MTRQMSLFGDEPDLPGVEAGEPAYRPDPDEVRAEFLSVLAKARAARTFPWDARRTLF